MLTLTEPAVEMIRTLTIKPGMPEKCGLRISHQDTAGSIALAIASSPEADDEIIETDGIRVFLQPEAAAMLTNRTLSARMAEDGPVFRIDEIPPA